MIIDSGNNDVEASYCPWLPFVAGVLLHFLNASKTYSVCAALLSGPPALITSRLETWTMLQAFTDLASEVIPSAVDYLIAQNPGVPRARQFGMCESV